MKKKIAIITVILIVATFFVLRALSPMVSVVDFEMTGHLTQGNPGLKPGAWYLVYEKPGSPALYKEIVFNEQSVCLFNKNKGVCPDMLLPSSALTHLRGISQGDTVLVVEAFTGTE